MSDELQHLIDSKKPGPFMLRRLAQLAIAGDRGITDGQIADKLGVQKEAIYQYFRGELWPNGRTNEDRVEEALEEISAENGLGYPPVGIEITGPEDESGIPNFRFLHAPVQDAIITELMEVDPGMVRRS